MRVTVPARDRMEVRFPAADAEWPAPPASRSRRFQAIYADAASIELPVYTPATTEAFATYGVIDEGAVAQPVAAPQGVFPQYGGLEITTSSTALQALTDAVLYLVQYPYECTEQIASRILAVAALRDVLTAFEAEGLPSPSRIGSSRAERYSNDCRACRTTMAASPTGGRGQESIPFNTIHAAHALYRRRIERFQRPGGDAATRSGVSAPDRKSLSGLVQPAHPPDAQRLCPVCAQPDGRSRSR